MFHMQRQRRLPEEHARFYSAEICLALNFLHERGKDVLPFVLLGCTLMSAFLFDFEIENALELNCLISALLRSA